MNKQDSTLFEIIATFYEMEYGNEVEEIKDDLLQQIKSDYIPLAHSEFGSITDFSATTVYIPSQKAVVKNIFSFEYEQPFEEKLYFKDNEEFVYFLYNESFDGLLEPKIEEEKLIEICKCAS